MADARPAVGAGELFLHEGDRGRRVPDQSSRLLPFLELDGCPGIAIVAVVVAGRGHPQVDPYHVVAAARVQARLEVAAR